MNILRYFYMREDSTLNTNFENALLGTYGIRYDNRLSLGNGIRLYTAYMNDDVFGLLKGRFSEIIASNSEVANISYLAADINAAINAAGPIGIILPWAKSLSGVPALPSNWLECNGQTISDSDSPLDGVTLPDLNGAGRFLYGAATSGSTKTENFLPSHNHEILTHYFGGPQTGRVEEATGTSPSSGSRATQNNSAGTAWVAYSVVYIIKYKN